MKTEPSVFGFEDLLKCPHKTTHWEGVRNYQARNFMRDEFKKNDLCLIYHSNTDEPAILGVAKVVKEAYSDDTALEPKNRYYDERASKGRNPWVRVDIQALYRLKRPLNREVLRAHPILCKMGVLEKGSRLSIQPVKPVEFETVLEIAGVAKV